jgi:2-keto-4-pentenoate hydratase/2-oxohepta-3-ene-1,7-dioic acid hydratase in catechol pathway
MRFVTFAQGSTARLGLLAGTHVIDLHAADPELPEDMRCFLEAGPGVLERAAAVLQGWAAGRLSPTAIHPQEGLTLLPPIPNPSKVVAVGANYWDHCRETGMKPPESPVLFAKFPTSLIGDGQTIQWDPSLSAEVDYEAELAVVIGRRARSVPADRALEVVAGYACANDVTARDLQRGDGQWARGKSLDTFCPLGPCLVTRDEIPDPGRLAIACRVNGQTVQDSSTAEMIFAIPTLIEFITRAFTLLPGDVILTGTPHGTGGFRQPRLFLRDGDIVEVEVEKVGLLRNPCREVARPEA